MRRVDPETLAQELIAVRVGLWAIATRLDVVELVEMVAEPDLVEHSACIRRITVREDESAAGQTVKKSREPLVALEPVQCDVMYIREEMVGIYPMFLHQPRECRAVLVEVSFLYAPRLFGAAVEQPLNIGSHSLVDQVEQSRRRRIQAIIEIEDPVADVGEAAIHAAKSPKEFNALSKLKGFCNHKN